MRIVVFGAGDLGVPCSRKPVTVYSACTANIIAAMENHGVRRPAVAREAIRAPRKT